MGPEIAPFLMLGAGVVEGIGAYAAGQYGAAQSRQQAKIARIQSDQIDAAYNRDLNSTLNNIQAIRATAGVGMDSPTGIALQRREERVSDRNRMRDVANRQMQVNQDEADARMKRASASVALFGGVAKGLTSFFGS